MSTTLKPESIDQLREAVAWAVAEEAQLELIGRGSKRALGRPLQTAHTLDLSALSGVRLYEPEELVMTAGAATPMAEIEALLAEKSQMLAFEPADLGPLYGGLSGAASIGGVLACNLGGPRRVKSGAPRDHFLGFAGVSGRGEIFKAGGRVVKNVTGYDLCKLLAGSFGTLAALSEVTVKVVPAPPRTRTVLVFGLDAAAAIAALADALNSPWEVSGAAHLPEAVARRSAVDYLRNAGAAVTAVRVEGTPISAAARVDALRKALAAKGAVEELHSMNSRKLWREIRDVAALLPDAAAVIWRVSVPPASAPSVAAEIHAKAGDEHYFDWGGGLIWLALPPAQDGGASAVRGAIAACGGHATLVRGPLSLRGAVDVFQPEPTALAALTARVKEGFDPRRVLNPGRMYPGV